MTNKPKWFLFYPMLQSKAHLSCLELKFAISTSTWKKVSMKNLFDDPLLEREGRTNENIMKLKQIFHIKLWEEKRRFLDVYFFSSRNQMVNPSLRVFKALEMWERRKMLCLLFCTKRITAVMIKKKKAETKIVQWKRGEMVGVLLGCCVHTRRGI